MGDTKQLQKLVVVTSHTWGRDSHDLYDYEAETYINEEHQLTTSSIILRDKSHIFTYPYPDSRDHLNSSFDHLFTIKLKENPSQQYEVYPAEKGLHSGLNLKKLWQIVRYLPNEKYSIIENDLIKLGRCKLIVRQLIFARNSASQKSTSSTINYDVFRSIEASISLSEMNFLQCRICLCEGGTEEDPLIKACACRGTIEHVHVGCLQKWYEQKQESHNETSSNCFCLKLIRCELCKQPLPIVVKRNKTILRIFQIPQHILNSPPLIVLENLVGNNPRAYHIISINRKVKLGRGHECDVRIPDVSISRHHATMNYENDCFTIQDEKSKFGTLVSLKQPLPIKNSDQLVLQAGRSVLKLEIVENSDLVKKSSTADSSVPVETSSPMDTSDTVDPSPRNNILAF